MAIRRYNYAEDLEIRTNSAYEHFEEAVSQRDLDMIVENLRQFYKVKDSIKERLGEAVDYTHPTDEATEFDRYLLQYIIAEKALTKLHEQVREGKSLPRRIPKPRRPYHSIENILRKIDNSSSSQRYLDVRNMVNELTSHHNYQLVIKIMEHVRNTYPKLDPIKYGKRELTIEELWDTMPYFKEYMDKRIKEKKEKNGSS